MVSRFKAFLIAVLIFDLILPFQVLAGAATASSVAIMPVTSDKNSTEGQLAVELSYALSRELGAKVNIIAPDVLLQSNKTSNLPGLSKEYLDLYKRLAAARNKYSLAGDADAAIAALDALGVEILQNQNFNRETSKIYESVSLSKAWIFFQKKDTDSAAHIIHTILAAKADHSIDTLGYPSSFRNFIKKQSVSQNSEVGYVTIQTKPSAVDVFFNGFYAGNSSNQMTVPVGKVHIALASGNRKTIHKEIQVTNGQSQNLRATLGWQRDKSNDFKSIPEDPLQQISYSAATNQGVHANKIVFIGIKGDANGYQVFAKVFDQQFHQPLAVIQYPKKITDIRSEAPKLQQYISSKIKPYLLNPANQLWKEDYDKQINLDDRVALRPREPITRKPAFWVAVGTAVIGGTVLGLVLSQHGSSSSDGSGSVKIDLGGF